jgi:hypothetical protein
MKILFLTIIIIPLFSFGQKTPIGSYAGHYGEKLEIRQDSTFYYSWSFDMTFSWTRGFWKVDNDTLLLNIDVVWDTVFISGKDKLVLSFDSLASRENKATYYDTLRSYGQSLDRYPKKLFLKKDRLYRISQTGNIDKRRARGIWTPKKIPTWFRRK